MLKVVVFQEGELEDLLEKKESEIIRALAALATDYDGDFANKLASYLDPFCKPKLIEVKKELQK